MKGFISYAEPIKQLLERIITVPRLHGRWLNTLSFMENCGARKIAACEHPTLVREEMLKHAAEEFRHAHHLKKQIRKVSSHQLTSYSPKEILGGRRSLRYLDALDLGASRYLVEAGLAKEAAYLLVTYAIELRANELYSLYDQILRQKGCRVAIKPLLLEEQEHLQEMLVGLAKLPEGELHAEKICRIEGKLCKQWLKECADFFNAKGQRNEGAKKSVEARSSADFSSLMER